MFRSARMIVGLGLFGGVSLTVVGWATGVFGQVPAFVGGLWQRLAAWLSTGLGWDHLLAGVGVLIVPAIVLAVIFAIADN